MEIRPIHYALTEVLMAIFTFDDGDDYVYIYVCFRWYGLWIGIMYVYVEDCLALGWLKIIRL